MEITAGKYIVKLLDRNDKDYQALIEKVFKLRYVDMILEYNKDADKDGLDYDEYDKYCDHLVAIDTTNNEVVGTYRLIIGEHTKNITGKFLLEKEFNIDDIKNSNKKILEVGRAVVQKDHRDGTVISLLWKGLSKYIKEMKIDVLLGTASFLGLDPTKYSGCISYIKDQLLCEYNLYAINNVVPMDSFNDKYDEKEVIRQMPALIKGYMKVGSKFGRDLYVDYDFHSVDVLVVFEIEKLNKRYIDRFINK